MATARETGTVRRTNKERGHGFITTSNAKTVFFMRRDVRPTQNEHRPFPEVGEKVSFILVPIEKVDESGRKLADQAIDIEVL